VELDVRHLRLVVAIADAGSLSAAARQLDLRQPTVSTQLRRIEDLLGGPLFVRTPHGVQTTDRGAAVLRRARPMLARLEALGGDEPEPPHPEVIRVRTFVLPFEVFHPLLEQLAPGVRWEVTAGGAADGLAAVATGEADLYYGFWWGDDDPAPAGVQVDEVLEERAWVLLPAGHPRARDSAVSLRSLAGERWACRPEPELHRALLRDCRRGGFEPDVQFRVVDTNALMSLIGSGGAIALTSPLEPLAGDTVLRPCSDTRGNPWVLGHRPATLPPALLRMLVDLMRWGYAFRARGNEELRAILPSALLDPPFPQPYAAHAHAPGRTSPTS
jgi:DNA-binding transcriptional LysR family regulator